MPKPGVPYRKSKRTTAIEYQPSAAQRTAANSAVMRAAKRRKRGLANRDTRSMLMCRLLPAAAVAPTIVTHSMATWTRSGPQCRPPPNRFLATI